MNTEHIRLLLGLHGSMSAARYAAGYVTLDVASYATRYATRNAAGYAARDATRNIITLNSNISTQELGHHIASIVWPIIIGKDNEIREAIAKIHFEIQKDFDVKIMEQQLLSVD